MWFLTRRLIQGLGVLVTVSFLTCALVTLAPGDFLSEARLDPRISAVTLHALEERYGLDRPLLVRYQLWLRSAAHGDLGVSFAYAAPVATLLIPRARHTLLLTSAAALVSWAIALLIGVAAAARPEGWLDRLAGAATSFLVATPELVVVTALLLLAARTRLLPAGGMTSIDFAERDAAGKAGDLALHALLPLVAIVLGMVPSLLRHVRTSVAEVLGSDFIRAGVARGVPRWRILFFHALRPASNPLISLAALSVGGLLSTSFVVEVVMSWPGLGPLLLEAILSRDVFVVSGTINITAALIVAATFLGDLALYASDPRIRRL